MPTKTNIDKLRDDARSGEPSVTEPSEIKTQLDSMTARLEEAEAAVKSVPGADEIKALADTIAAIKVTVDDLPADYGPQLKALTEQVDKLQTGAALLIGKAAGAPAGIKAITSKIAESDIYKSIFTPDGQRGPQIVGNGQWTPPTPIESYAAARFKAASPVVISDMAGGTTEVFRPGVVEARDWLMDIVSRIPSVITRNANKYTVPRETVLSRYGAWKSTLQDALDGDPTPKSAAKFIDTEGLMNGSVVRFYNASGVVLGSAVVVSFDPATDVVTFVTNSLTWDADAGWAVSSENYAAIAELGEKPSGSVGSANESFDLKTLATVVPTTVQALNTIMGLAALIERKMPLRARRNKSRHIIYGDGTADEMQGLRTYSGAQAYLWSSGVSGDNQVDAIMRAINLIPWGVPIAVLMSQLDLPALTLLKGSDEHYMRTGGFGQVPLTQIGLSWFLGAHELVFDYAVASGDFTPINFAGASEIADQDTASLMWGYIDKDFVNNIIRARLEETWAHAIVDANEYVVAEWDAAP